MATRTQFIRHATVQADVFEGLEGEVTVELTKKTIKVHDGITPGGQTIAREDLDNAPSATAAKAGKMTALLVQELNTATATNATQDGRLTTNEADIVTNAAAILTNTNFRLALALLTAGNGASLIGVEDAATNFASTDVEAVLAEIIATYAAVTAGNGASKIGVQDAASNFTASDVEAVLAEIGSARVSVVDSNNTAISQVNNAAEKTIYSHAIPANTGKAGGKFRLTITGEIFNASAGAVIYFLRATLGSTTLVNTGSALISAAVGATNRSVKIVIDIAVISSASQHANIQAKISSSTSDSNLADFTAGNGVVRAANMAVTEDLTAALTLLVAMQMGTADANASFTKRSATLEYLP